MRLFFVFAGSYFQLGAIILRNMPATHRIDNEAKLIITTWDGEATDTSLINALIAYQKNIQKNPEYDSYAEIIDFRDTPVTSVTIDGIKSLAKIAAQTDEGRAGNKVAIIVSSSLAYNLVRLYAVYRNFGRKKKKQVQVYKDEREAYEWASGD